VRTGGHALDLATRGVDLAVEALRRRRPAAAASRLCASFGEKALRAQHQRGQGLAAARAVASEACADPLGRVLIVGKGAGSMR
jgi:hypothetical protein